VLARQRQELILEQVRRDGGVRVSELVQRLGVSDMTVRRDIEALAARGLVARVHGGATDLRSHSADEPGFSAKSSLQTDEKQAIAVAAARLVEPGSSIALSAGTTTYAVARRLLDVPELTVVTNSVPVAQLLHESQRKDLTVVLTGGVRTPSDALVGPVAVTALRGLHVDLVFMGVHGLDGRAGLTTPNLVEGETDRAMLDCGRTTVVCADASKWGVVALSTIAPLTGIDVLVTDDGLPGDARQAIASQVGRLVLAPTAATDVTPRSAREGA
jgi:DeoR/GlpR family transcriptional regulator of sugar metabolism